MHQACAGNGNEPGGRAGRSGMGDTATVLVVDDDPDVRTMLAQLLWRCGFYVDVAANALDAIDALERGSRPSAVVTDFRMPGLVGTELIEYMRDRSDLSTIPVALVSAWPQHAPRGCPVFTKPFDAQALVSFLRATIV